ncbi:MAG: putative zinc protease [Holosporales bacterium]
MKKITVLPNGIRVATDAIDHVETVSLGGWFAVGARFEDESVNGISHVLEHMAFKGTTNRTALEISQSIENVGGYLNAYTSRESTAYYARLLKDDAHLGIDVLGDILQNSVFDAAELEKEKKVILQEIGQTLDTPDDIIFDYFQQTCFPDQAIGRSILGPASNVSGFTNHQVKDYMKTHYGTQNMVFAAAGKIQHDDFVEKVQETFGNFPSIGDFVKEPARYVGGDFRQEKDLEQVHVVMGYAGVGYGDADYYAQMLAATLLGGGMSSRLFQEIREKRGLVYTIHAYASPFDGGGIFGIYAGTGREQVEELLPLTVRELKNLGSTIQDHEIKRAKAQLKANLMMGLESTSHRCERIANQLLTFNRIIETDDVLEKIEAVTPIQILNYMEKTLSSTPTLATLGPVDRVMPYADFLSCHKGS